MNNLRNKKATLAIATAVFLGGCGLKQMAKMAQSQEIKVTPSPIEVHGDSVIFDVNATLPTKMLKKNKLYTVKTYYKFGQPGQELESIQFSDTEFPNQKVEQPSASRRFSFLYEESMENGAVYIKGVASNLEKTKFQDTPEMEVAKGIITTPRLAKNAYQPVYAFHGYNNQEELEAVNVVFNFDQGSAVLRKSEVQGEAGKGLDAFIASKFKTKTVTITGTHSPEGSESKNEKLSENRAKVIQKFYSERMKKYDYKNLADSIKFETKTVFQNWDKLKATLATYTGISDDEKKQVLNIVNSGASFVDAEKQIEKLSFYKKLLKEVYPQLRTSSTAIQKIKIKKTDAEISILAKSVSEGSVSADTLTFEELMYGATLTPILEEKEKIYLASTKKKDSWTAHNNLAVVYLLMASKINDESAKAALVKKADDQIQISVKKEKNAENLNNAGIVSLLKGDKKQALEIFSEAVQAKATDKNTVKFAKAGLATAQIRYAKYSDAVRNSNEAADTVKAAIFNAGLALLVSKDYNGAIQQLEKAVAADANDALAYYCLAVAHARNNNITELARTLTKAASLDSKLKARAVNDLEFAKFADQEAFKAALK